jgi:cyclase
MKQLTKNIYIETGWSGANVGYVITTDGLVMIDTPHKPSDALKWKEEVESKGKVKYLINTEAHEDHSTGAFFFKATVVAHEKAREEIVNADIKQILERVVQKDPNCIPLIKDYKVNVPSITFSERLTLYVGKHSFHLIHVPGHSAGQIAVLIPEEKVVFTGDNVCCKMQSFLHEADPYAWLESIDRIGAMDVDYIVPGHGDVCDKSYLREEKTFIQDCIDKINNAIKNGWTKDETLAKVSFRCYPMDSGLEVFGPVLLELSVAHIYELLSRKK